MKTTTLALAALLLVPAAHALADGAADDLAVVRKAVASPHPAEAAPARRPEAPKWLRVRITEKGEKGAKVKVNLPLGLVRALGDDIPLPACEGVTIGKHLTLGEVLRALDSGESLVEIDDEDATVRVWVE